MTEEKLDIKNIPMKNIETKFFREKLIVMKDKDNYCP